MKFLSLKTTHVINLYLCYHNFKAEKSTLSEALRENEQEVLRLRGIVQEKDGKLVKADEQTSLMVRRAEQRSQVEFTDR